MYNSPPNWNVGTFRQTAADEGELELHVDDVSDAAARTQAAEQLDKLAEQFRLAISWQTGCPLAMKHVRSVEPAWLNSTGDSLSDAIAVSDAITDSVGPRPPPAQIPQFTRHAARWIHTYTDAHWMDAYPDEMIKRYFLVLEELEPGFRSSASPTQRVDYDRIRCVRNFVSHPHCVRPTVVQYVMQHLPSASVAPPPPPASQAVRFDRTSFEHEQFVRQHIHIASALAQAMVNHASAAAPL